MVLLFMHGGACEEPHFGIDANRPSIARA